MKNRRLLLLVVPILALSALVFWINRSNRLQLRQQIEAVTRSEGAVISELLQKSGSLLAERDPGELENFLQRLSGIPALMYAGMRRGKELLHLYTRYEGYFPVSPDLPQLALLESPLGTILNVQSRFNDGTGNQWVIDLGFHSQYLDTLNQNARKAFLLQALIVLVFTATVLILLHLLNRRFFRHELELQRERESRQRLEELALFSAEIAHEIRNPLNSLGLTLDVVRERVKTHTDERTDHYLTATRDEVRRITSILESYSRLSRPVMPDCRRVDISLLLNELKTALAGELSAHAAGLEFDAPSAFFPVDPDLLRQILRNLIQNSIEAGADRITLSARLTPNQLQMDIRDNGRGIEPGLQAGIFQPYISGKTKGTGLGLFVVRRLITAMNGSVSLQESRPGYTHFFISLPGGGADEQ